MKREYEELPGTILKSIWARDFEERDGTWDEPCEIIKEGRDLADTTPIEVLMKLHKTPTASKPAGRAFNSQMKTNDLNFVHSSNGLPHAIFSSKSTQVKWAASWFPEADRLHWHFNFSQFFPDLRNWSQGRSLSLSFLTSFWASSTCVVFELWAWQSCRTFLSLLSFEIWIYILLLNMFA